MERQRPGPFCPDPLAGPPSLSGKPKFCRGPGPPLPLVFHARLALLRALAQAASPPRSPFLHPAPSHLLQVFAQMPPYQRGGVVGGGKVGEVMWRRGCDK